MKMILFRSLFLVLLLSLFSVGLVRAHGEPTITADPSVAAPGEQVTITGTDMEDGEVFKLSLESAVGVIELGEATAKQDGDEAGFTTVVTLPSDLTAGSYFIQAATDEGESTTADLTIATSAESMNMTTESTEASAEPLAVDRSKSPLVIGSVIVLALISAGAGVSLIRWHE